MALDLGVGVYSVQRIFATRERIEDSLVIRTFGQCAGSLRRRLGVEIRQHFIHAAKFGFEDGLLLVARSDDRPET